MQRFFMLQTRRFEQKNEKERMFLGVNTNFSRHLKKILGLKCKFTQHNFIKRAKNSRVMRANSPSKLKQQQHMS